MPLVSVNNDQNSSVPAQNPVNPQQAQPTPTATTATPVPAAALAPINSGQQQDTAKIDHLNPYNIKEYADPVSVQPVAETNEDLDVDSKMGNLSALQNQIDSIAENGTEVDAPKQEMVSDAPAGSDKEILDKLLISSINLKATDIHITANNRAILRIDGKIQIGSSKIISADEVSRFVNVLLATRKDTELKEKSEIDLNYVVGSRRFRVNIFRQMGNYSISMRVIPDKIMTLEEIGMPEIVKTFSGIPNGLILVTGPTGSGKSTTIASMLNLINLTMPKHILTLEDPVEYVFPKGIGLLEQREYGIDFLDWESAIRALLRQDPDIVLIGEMRDLDTIESALKIAETGHLVFATLHTNSAAETINRIIDVFDNTKQEQIRIQLSSVLRAVISQRLIPITQGGRRAAVEVLISTPGVKNAIRDKKVFQLDNIIQTSSDLGMMSMDQSLAKMVMQGLISKDTAKSFSLNPDQIDILLTRR